MSDSVKQFSVEATRFRDWALTGTDTGPEAAREALVLITSLYLAALALPKPWSEDLEAGSKTKRADSDAQKFVYPLMIGRLPFYQYSEVFNPLSDTPAEPVVGNLADNIADIFRDA